MAKGTKKQYKQYDIATLEDACLVMKSLIVPVIIHLDKFGSYSEEAAELLKNTQASDTISAQIYDSLHDKTLYQQRELLKFMADHQSSSFSYIEVRKILERKGFLKRRLDEENCKILNELLDIRNWSFHNAQSMTVADKEIAKKAVPPELKDYAEVKPLLNPVVVRRVKSYSREMLVGFVKHNTIRLKQFETILEEMKKDYQCMENFFGTLKTECLYRAHFSSRSEVEQLISEYIDFYSFERISLKNGLTPVEIRDKAAQTITIYNRVFLFPVRYSRNSPGCAGCLSLGGAARRADGLLPRHAALGLLDQALDHVSADIAGLTGGQVAVVALLQVDAQLAGDLVLHVVQGLTGLGHDNAIAVAVVGRTVALLELVLLVLHGGLVGVDVVIHGFVLLT